MEIGKSWFTSLPSWIIIEDWSLFLLAWVWRIIEISATLTGQAVALVLWCASPRNMYMRTEANLYKSVCVPIAYGTVLSSKWLCSRNSEISSICGCWNLRYKLLALPCFLFLLNEASIKDSRLSPSHVEVLQNLPQGRKQYLICLCTYLFTCICLCTSELKGTLRLQSQAIWGWKMSELKLLVWLQLTSLQHCGSFW